MTPVVIPDVYLIKHGERSTLVDLELRADQGTVDLGFVIDGGDDTASLSMNADDALRLAAHLRELAFALKPSLREPERYTHGDCAKQDRRIAELEQQRHELLQLRCDIDCEHCREELAR